MNILHIDILPGELARHDETYAKGYSVTIEIFRLTISFWVGI